MGDGSVAQAKLLRRYVCVSCHRVVDVIPWCAGTNDCIILADTITTSTQYAVELISTVT